MERVKKIKTKIKKIKQVKINKKDVIKIAEIAINNAFMFESYDGWLEHVITELETKFNIKVL